MRVLSLILVLSLQVLSVPSWGDGIVPLDSDAACLTESLYAGDSDDSAAFRRHPAGRTCLLAGGFVVRSFPCGVLFPRGGDHASGVAAPVVAPVTFSRVSVLRC